MKANIDNVHEGIALRSCRKENSFYKQYSVYALDIKNYNGDPREIVCLRIYATDARHYACMWINSDNIYGFGGGRAGGYGYHRGSAAAQDAITDAGVKLSESIEGRGDEAIVQAVKAIAKAMGSSNYFVGEAHA